MRYAWVMLILVGCQPGDAPSADPPAEPPRPTMREWLEAGDAGREILQPGDAYNPGEWQYN